MWKPTGNLEGVGHYRVRLLALELEEFTVKELEAAAGVSPQVVHAFIHNELDAAGPNLVKREKLETGGKPGRPPFRYTLTPEAIDLLAKKNLALARELDGLTSQPPRFSVKIPGSDKVLHAEREINSLGAERNTPTIDRLGQSSIDNSLCFKGELSGSKSSSGPGSLLIDGLMEGAINLPAHRVTIGHNGQVNANIIAREIVIMGRVHGNLTADEVKISADGSLYGDIICHKMSIDDGAFFKGGITIRKSHETGGYQSSPASDRPAAERFSQSEERARG